MAIEITGKLLFKGVIEEVIASSTGRERSFSFKLRGYSGFLPQHRLFRAQFIDFKYRNNNIIRRCPILEAQLREGDPGWCFERKKLWATGRRWQAKTFLDLIDFLYTPRSAPFIDSPGPIAAT